MYICPWHLFRWLKEVFLLADKSGDGLLSVDEVFSLMHELNVKIPNRKLRETFKLCLFSSSTAWNSLEKKTLLDGKDKILFFEKGKTLHVYKHGKYIF